MNEGELYQGITDALTIAGWRWIHTIRSDGNCTGTGAFGWPDIAAVHPARAHFILWELKGEHGQATPDQWAWIGPLAVVSVALSGQLGVSAQFDCRIVTPDDYDAALSYIVGKTDRMVVRG